MEGLDAQDQDAIALRFFKDKSLREVGEALGISEDAAQKRVSRALEALRSHFARRGITASATLIASTIGAHAVQPAPSGLAGSVAGVSLAGAGGITGAGLTIRIIEVMTTTKAKLAAVALVLAAAVSTPIVMHYTSRTPKGGGEAAMQESAKQTGKKNAQDLVPVSRPVSEVVSALGKLGAEPDYENRYLRVRELADAIAISDIPTAIARVESWHMQERADKMYDRQSRAEFIRLLISRLARSNPQLAVETAVHLAPSMSNNALDFSLSDLAIEIALGEWAHRDVAGAIAFVQSHPLEWGAGRLKPVLIQALANQNPEAALALADSQVERERYYSTIFAKWAATDLSAALARAQGLPAGALKRDALSGLLQTWALTDPSAASSFVQGLPSEGYKGLLLGEVAKRYAEADPTGALNWCKSMSSRPERFLTATWIVDSVAASDPKAAAEFRAAEDLPLYYAYLIAQQWARKDIAGAVEWMKQLPEGNDKQRTFDVIAGRWAQADPKAAAEFALSLPTEPAAGGGPPVNNRETLVTQVAQAWATQAPRAAITWAQDMPDGPLKNRVLTIVSETWATTAPAEAAKFVAELSPGHLQNETALRVASAWGAIEPQTAAGWVAEFPEGQVRNNAICGLISSWASNDLAGAEAWLKTLPVEKTPEQAVPNFVYAASFLGPEAGARWVARLPEGPQREVLINCLASQWVMADESAAKQWVQQTAMSDEIKERWLSWKPQ